jgi:hypothetical protein
MSDSMSRSPEGDKEHEAAFSWAFVTFVVFVPSR